MAAKDMALFTDISWWNGAVDFAKMKAAGAQGVIIRAGSINNVTGIPYTDVQFERNADLAPQFFDNVAFYWFMRLNHNINLQADYFCNLVANKAFDWLEPDIEMEGDVAGLFQFTARIEENLPGVYQVIYTNPNTWLFLLTGDQSPAIKYDLHEAHWGVDTPQPLEPWKSAGRAAVIHQFSSEGNGLGETYGAPPTAEKDMDLNWVKDDWLKQFEELPPEPPPLPEPPPEPELLMKYETSKASIRTVEGDNAFFVTVPAGEMWRAYQIGITTNLYIPVAYVAVFPNGDDEQKFTLDGSRVVSLKAKNWQYVRFDYPFPLPPNTKIWMHANGCPDGAHITLQVYAEIEPI